MQRGLGWVGLSQETLGKPHAPVPRWTMTRRCPTPFLASRSLSPWLAAAAVALCPSFSARDCRIAGMAAATVGEPLNKYTRDRARGRRSEGTGVGGGKVRPQSELDCWFQPWPKELRGQTRVDSVSARVDPHLESSFRRLSGALDLRAPPGAYLCFGDKASPGSGAAGSPETKGA